MYLTYVTYKTDCLAIGKKFNVLIRFYLKCLEVKDEFEQNKQNIKLGSFVMGVRRRFIDVMFL